MDGHDVVVRALGETQSVGVPEGTAVELVPGGRELVVRLGRAPPVDLVVAEAQHVRPVLGQPCGDLRQRSGEEQVVPVEEEQIGPARRGRTGVAGRARVPGAVEGEQAHPGVSAGALPRDGELRRVPGGADCDQLQAGRSALRLRLLRHGLQGRPQIPLNAVGGHYDTEEHDSRA